MNTHHLKTDPEWFQLAHDGIKNYEIRRNDRGYRVGDLLELKETTHNAEEMANGAPLEYTGRILDRKITHIFTGLPDNMAILSVEPVIAFRDNTADIEARLQCSDDEVSALKPCPFCGSKAELIETGAGISVCCTSFDCGMGSQLADWTEEGVIERWNTRANETNHQNLPKAAKELIVKAWQDGAYIVGEYTYEQLVELSEKYSEKESGRIGTLIAEIEAAAVEQFASEQFTEEAELFQNYVHKDAASDWAAKRRGEASA